MKHKHKILSAVALLSAIVFSGCAVPHTYAPEGPSVDIADNAPPDDAEQITPPADVEEEVVEEPDPLPETASYIRVTATNVNIRKGASTSYASVGQAEANTLYICLGEENGWYKTYYKNSTVYIYKKYCEVVLLPKMSDDVEKVIEEGCKYLGVQYVYGAVRYHDGTGRLNSGFTATKFDCSSLMQYIFKLGANVNLQVNTRTQAVQGTAVARAEIQRGDLLFFTNASRKHLTGIERIGHVALYLGENLILHTSSDYAKIEEISSARWSNYIQANRML